MSFTAAISFQHDATEQGTISHFQTDKDRTKDEWSGTLNYFTAGQKPKPISIYLGTLKVP